VGGVPLNELLSPEKIDALVQRAVNGGAEIVGLLKTGSAYCAPSAAAVSMVDSIVLDRKDVVPCAVQLKGEYGITDVVVGVPVKLGESGVEQVFELALLEDEIAALQRSADAVRQTVAMMGF